MKIIGNHNDGDPVSESGLSKRLEKDLSRLRSTFGCDLYFDPTAGTYTLNSMTRPLIDLSAAAIRGLAFLGTTFDDTSAPMYQEVHALSDAVLMLISDGGREEAEHMRGLIEVDLRQRDEDKIPDNVWKAVQRACDTYCELEFEYLSPRHEEEITRTHRVEPMRCTFDPVYSHYYLDAYCIQHRGPNGIFNGDQVWRYRLGRISSPRILPQRFSPGQRKLKTHDLVYELAPEIARRGVTKHIADCEIEHRPDGSAIVRAKSTDLFFDLRTLLHYGANCRVLGGEAALRETKVIIKKMAELYPDDLL